MSEEVKGLYEEYKGWAVWHSGGGIWLAIKDVPTIMDKLAVFVVGYDGASTAKQVTNGEFCTRKDYFSSEDLVNPDDIIVAEYDSTKDEYVATEEGKAIFGEEVVLRNVYDGITVLNECLEKVFGVPRDESIQGALAKLEQRFKSL